MICLGRFGQTIAVCALPATAALAQTRQTPIPVPKNGGDLVVNPTLEECKAGWRGSLRWSKVEFERLCHQLEISK